NGEILFLYGNNYEGQRTAEHQEGVVFVMNDFPLSFGVTLRSTVDTRQMLQRGTAV
ncbi:uncharacterized protein EDB91DRAFT_1040775, partial [Suillus paluster]|uniref:uncharacterized protein n=1 Tax=Suillus paluster TaxID=48578 RepID=UPI001B86AA93